MAIPTYEYSGVCYTATAGQTTFALTTSGGNSIGYLKPEHIKVRSSVDNGGTWTGLSLNSDWVFADPATSIVLNSGAAQNQLIDIYRETPMDDDYIDFQAGSLLTAGQLNEFETWQLYIDQELADSTANLASSIPGSVVSQIVAGSNVSISPASGKGVVTISSTGSGGGGPANTDGLPEGSVNLYYTDARVESYVSGQGYVKDAGVTKLVAGTNIVLTPSDGLGTVTITGVGGGALTYMGLIDATQTAPAGPRNGDMYVNTNVGGTVDASWTGIGGESLTGNERLIYSTNNSSWGIIRDFGVPEAPSDSTLYGRKDQAWEAIPAAPTVYWSLSGSDLYPTDPSYNVGLGGTLLTPNIVLTAAGAGTFAGDVTAANLTATADVGAVNVTATGTVEGPSLVATGGGFSGTALQVSGSVSAGSYRIDLLNTLP